MQRLDSERFRQELVGLLDPVRETGTTEGAELRNTAIRFLCVLAKCYDVGGDRTKLWEHVGKAVETSLAKLGGAVDLSELTHRCLESVNADEATSTALPALEQLLETFESRDEAWRSAFLDRLRRNRRSMLVFARSRWQKVQSQEVEL